MKKKVLKIQIGEAFDKEKKQNFPVYASYWQQDDGSYMRTERIWVNEVELPDKKPEVVKVEA